MKLIQIPSKYSFFELLRKVAENHLNTLRYVENCSNHIMCPVWTHVEILEIGWNTYQIRRNKCTCFNFFLLIKQLILSKYSETVLKHAKISWQFWLLIQWDHFISTFQRFSTIFNDFQRIIATYFNLFQRILTLGFANQDPFLQYILK